MNTLKITDSEMNSLMQEALYSQKDNPPKANGKLEAVALTPAGMAAVKNGLAQHQAMIDEVDALTKQTNVLLAKIAGLEAQNEVYKGNLNEAISRLNSAVMVRDQCVADCAKYETLFLSIKGDLQRFLTPGATLVKAKDEPTTGL